MQKTVRKKTCKIMSCKNHAKTMSKSCQNHVMQTCKNHAKTMQKPCKHAKTMQHAARTLASTLRKNVQAVRVMQKTSCSTCHEKTARKTVRKNVQAVRVMQKTSCSTCHAKTMQKPCKHAKTMQHAARTLASTQAGAARRLLCQASGAQFCCNIAATRVSHGAILNQIVGGSSMQGIPAFPVSLSVEGVFQMAYILPERLLALVRPAFDLVLRRIRSLKRCVQA